MKVVSKTSCTRARLRKLHPTEGAAARLDVADGHCAELAEGRRVAQAARAADRLPAGQQLARGVRAFGGRVGACAIAGGRLAQAHSRTHLRVPQVEPGLSFWHYNMRYLWMGLVLLTPVHRAFWDYILQGGYNTVASIKM